MLLACRAQTKLAVALDQDGRIRIPDEPFPVHPHPEAGVAVAAGRRPQWGTSPYLTPLNIRHPDVIMGQAVGRVYPADEAL